MVGYLLIVYGLLMCGCIMVFYEGKLVCMLDVGVYWWVIEEYRVNSLFCVLMVICVICKEDLYGEWVKCYDLGLLCYLFLVGEKFDSSI